MELNRFKQLLESTLGNVKPLITEDDEQKNKYDELINSGLSPMQAYYLVQIKNGWEDILINPMKNKYGFYDFVDEIEIILQELFLNSRNFYEFFKGQSTDPKIKKFYPPWDLSERDGRLAMEEVDGWDRRMGAISGAWDYQDEEKAHIILSELGYDMTKLVSYTRKELAQALRQENKENNNEWEELAKKLDRQIYI